MLKDLLTLIPYIRRYFWTYVAGCLCLLASNGLALLIPWLTKQTIEHLQYVRQANELARPHLFAILILVVAAVQMVIRIGSRWFLLGNSRKVAHDMRNNLFAHLQTLNPSYYIQMPTGDLMSRTINDMQYVQSLVGPVILYVTSTLIMYIGAIPIMLSMSARLTLLALIPYPLFMVIFKRFASELFSRSKTVQERLADVSTQAQESMSGIQIIKAYVQEESQSRHFEKLSRNYFDSNIGLIKVHSLLTPMIRAVGAIGMLVIISYGGASVIAGRITLGEFVAFSGYLAILAMPTAFLGMIISASQRGLSSLRRVNEVFQAQPTITDTERTTPFVIEHGEIEVQDLSFAYPSIENGNNGRFALRNLSFSIPAGSTVAIVGHTGSGKTTLVHLIARLLEIEPGKIFIDGRDITSIPLAELRSKLALVPQESFLFSLTLRENISFGSADGEGSVVEKAARLAGLEPDISGFPSGLETIIGERGINLSGGQRQRTALARALAANPTILILDDAFSSVDTHTEEQVLKNLRQVLKERTTIMISHRISTVKDADKILVMEEGQIVEEGSHESLIQLKGIYADLYEKQLLMEELEEL
ncbi:MAG: ABC transporter ATP-binding protein [Candidatus Abyssobacteria bacterium SURF_5]|uniref:ABC transporter ATP-binding protein n=1 Tax=Abyssobacteria bacterium (strain SURF_5) TaxID=2093360 RepID=A0A3A4NEU7_ABYX5|nr:MAG: ABC transporter ATP-binding protein [Candidatus Abyssubacteria bacterium SURF_5]